MENQEFKSKYYTQAVVKFEPPTWEEFQKNEDFWFYCPKTFVQYSISNAGRYIEVYNYENDKIIATRTNTIQGYYELLDIALKLFKGE